MIFHDFRVISTIFDDFLGFFMEIHVFSQILPNGTRTKSISEVEKHCFEGLKTVFELFWYVRMHLEYVRCNYKTNIKI